ncbi:hypothetical protein DFH06DRAFT_1136889 [Mycena polygramma]|nr:hypothetical protein DFH06DRAFT_1136889 [Mycena polygramma]
MPLRGNHSLFQMPQITSPKRLSRNQARKANRRRGNGHSGKCSCVIVNCSDAAVYVQGAGAVAHAENQARDKPPVVNSTLITRSFVRVDVTSAVTNDTCHLSVFSGNYRTEISTQRQHTYTRKYQTHLPISVRDPGIRRRKFTAVGMLVFLDEKFSAVAEVCKGFATRLVLRIETWNEWAERKCNAGWGTTSTLKGTAEPRDP